MSNSGTRKGMLVFFIAAWAWTWSGAMDEAAYNKFYQSWSAKLNRQNYPGQEIAAERCLYDYAAEQRTGGWNFNDGTMAGISYLDPNLQNVRVEGGKLKFTLGAEEVRFGWGQLEQGCQQGCPAPLDLQTRGWHLAWKARLKSDAAPVKIAGVFYRHGQPAESYADELKETNSLVTVPIGWPNNTAGQESYQGFALVITGLKGARIEVDSVSVGMETVRTYCRKVFELPADDPVYSALVNVGMNNAAFINGIQVHDKENLTCSFEYNVVPIDIRPYLKPGTNILALYSQLLENGPCTYACGAVILASGKEISLTTAEGWKVSAMPQCDWTGVDFDDTGWKAPNVRNPSGFGCGEYYPPLYSGPMILENPRFSKLMFSADQEVAVTLKLPAGYKKDNPVVTYTFADTDTGQTVASNTLTQFVNDTTAIRGTLVAGILKPGIYELSVAGRLGDQTLARSTPIMVAGHVNQKEVESYEFEEGMKLTLVDEIRCGEPQDPHPYMDSEGSKKDNRIISKDGMVYRETGPRRFKDYFVYKFTLPATNLFQPHVVDIAWPDNAQRSVQIGFLTEYQQEVQLTLAGATSFEKFPLSGTWQHFKCFWLPRLQTNYIVVANNMEGYQAAVGSIRIFRADDIPAFQTHPSGERFIGQMTIRNTIYGSHYTPGPFAQTLHCASANVPEFHRRWFKANETFIKIMRFSGENLWADSVFLFSRQNTGYAPVWRAQRAELGYNYQPMLAKQFESHGLKLVTGMQSCDYGPLANSEGYKWLMQIISDLADEYRDFTSFLGVQYVCFSPIYVAGSKMIDAFMPCFVTGPAGFVADEPYDSLLAGYDDVTMAAFEQETKIAIPVPYDDNERNLKRYRWLKENCLDQWVSWRCQKIHEFNLKALEILHKRRPDLQVYPTIDFDTFHSKSLAKRGLDPVAFLRCGGYDPSLDKDNESISWPRFYNQMLHHDRSYGSADWPLAEDFNTDPKLTEFWSGAKNRSAYILTHFDENVTTFEEQAFPPEFAAFKQRVFSGVWPGSGKLMISTTFMPPGEHCLAAFKDIIRDCDPDTLFYGWSDGCGMAITHLQYLRRISRAFVCLPRDKFTTLPGHGLDKNIVVKELNKQGKYYFYVLNDTCWDVDVELNVAASGPIKDLGRKEQVTRQDGRLSFKLLPYEMRSFLIEGKGSVRSAQTAVASAGRRFVTEKIEKLTRQMAASEKARRILKGPILDTFENKLASAGELAAADNISGAWRQLLSSAVQNVENNLLPNVDQLSSWYVIGCFPGDKFQIGFKKAYPVEQDVLSSGQIARDKVYQGDEGYERAVWQKVVTEPYQGLNGVVLLDTLYGQPDWKEAYAYAMIYSPEDRKCTLQVHSDDGIRVWIRGSLVLDHNIGRAIHWPPDKVEIDLKKGWNWTLVKLENVWSGWGFQFDFLKPDGSLYKDMPVICDADQNH